jgi:predicted AlkP superfamily pyrophosphatase or phosphodiesterase
MIVIDACASRVLVEAMADGKLPNFKALAETGYFSPNCLSIFPSITHAATAS